MIKHLSEVFFNFLPCWVVLLMLDSGVIFSPSSWEPQEEGMMNIAARFFPQLRNQGMSIRRGRSQTIEGDAC
jgi:hypothetical protein